MTTPTDSPTPAPDDRAGERRTALVTGATGYIGGHLVPALIEDGWTVAVTFGASGDATKRPRCFVTRKDAPRSAWAAVAPRQTSTCGCTTAISASSQGRQAKISSASGVWSAQCGSSPISARPSSGCRLGLKPCTGRYSANPRGNTPSKVARTVA